jgi:hypothetical protein
MKYYNLILPVILATISYSLPAQVQIQKPVKTIDRNIPIKNLPQAIDISAISMCIDRNATAGNLAPRDLSIIQPPPPINPDGSLPSTGVKRQPLAGETLNMWNPGQTIGVYLSTANSSDFVRQKVMTYARQWETIANIRFSFTNNINNAQVRVEFGTDKKNWSIIGRNVLMVPFNISTMHYGSFADNTSEWFFKSVILHEFGHALGFIHEHQSPANGIQWDKEKVYAYFSGPPANWSRAEIDFNVINKYASGSTNFSSYDSRSIMHYSIEPGLTLNGFSVGQNTDFSPTDIAFARQVYPFPVKPGNRTGTLQTGDDCDMVDYMVEYNVVPSDKIEFILELGKRNNKAVTWWKQITIPMTNNRKKELWVQNHSLIPSENITWANAVINVNEIDRSNGIAFWKGKALGFHTLLGYRWNVLSAIPGGSRVRLVWKNDSCL